MELSVVLVALIFSFLAISVSVGMSVYFWMELKSVRFGMADVLKKSDEVLASCANQVSRMGEAVKEVAAYVDTQKKKLDKLALDFYGSGGAKQEDGKGPAKFEEKPHGDV